MDSNVRYCGIDPSTKTGFVILNAAANVIYEKEFTSKKTDPERMIALWEEIKEHLNPITDKIIIEGFSYGSKGRGVSFQYGFGWVLRTFLYLYGFKFLDVAPKQLKKFACNNGNASKEDLIISVKEKWGFDGKTDNTRDAFVLALIGYSMDNQTDLLDYEKAIIKDLSSK